MGGGATARGMALALVGAVIAAACGPSGDTGGPTRLNLVMADDWATTAPVIDAVRSFEASHPDVRVRVRGVPFGQIPDDVRTSMESGRRTIDVAHWHAFAAGARDLAAPVGDLWGEHLDPEAFLPGAVEDVTWEGTRYGVPLDVNAMVMMLNQDMLADHGVRPTAPRRFGDVMRIAEAVTARDRQTRGIAHADSTWAAYGWIAANGGELVHVPDGGPARLTLDAPANVEALSFLGRMLERGLAFPPSSGNTSADSFAHFRGGTTAMHVAGSWDIATLGRAGLDWSLRVVPMPRGTDGTTTGSALGGSSLFVPRGSEHRELAFELMTHLIEDDTALRYATEEGRLPARRRVYDDEFFDGPDYRAVVEQLETAAPMRLIAFPEAQRLFALALQEILEGRQDARAALAEAQRQARRALASDSPTTPPATAGAAP